jgi:ABC-type Fe3+-hydroxamate transport system substrate-binding protein
MVVGGTKDPDLTKVRALNPTHILVNEEENLPETIAACRAIAETISTAPVLPEDSAKLIRLLGERLNCHLEAKRLADRLDDLLARIRENSGAQPKKSFICLIWREPYMAAGRNTYLSHAVSLLGWENGLMGEERYPELTAQQLKDLKLDHVLFTSEPYPFRKRHIATFMNQTGKSSGLYKADGQKLTWWGSMAEELFQDILCIQANKATDLLVAVAL